MSEKEGLLKKRIRVQFEDECTTDFDGFVAPIIDEAKKERPDVKTVQFDINNIHGGAKTWKELVQQYVQITTNWEAWFKKWVGDST